MAYTLHTYNVMDSAGITAEDNRATQVAKIADWINTSFGDIVTAETVSNLRVRVLDKKVKAGFGWGGGSDAQSFRYKYTATNSTDYSEWADYTHLSYPLETLGLFVCRTGDSFVIDFINTQNSMALMRSPLFMHLTGDVENTKKAVCLVAYLLNGSAETNLAVISENMITPSTNLKCSFFGYNNYNLDKTLLTRFTPLYENIVADDLYRIYGVMPETKSIFELNGVKYLTLRYSDSANNIDRLGFALKLDTAAV